MATKQQLEQECADLRIACQLARDNILRVVDAMWGPDSDEDQYLAELEDVAEGLRRDTEKG